MTLLAAAARRRSVNPWPLPESGTITTIPTYDGSGQTVHPSVVDMGADFGGYRWWLADTPYPNEDASLENPSILASNDRITWEVPPGVTNPLDLPTPASGASYNSDTELVWDDDAEQFVLLWRDYVGVRTPQMYYLTATSPDGTTWTVQEEPLMAMDPARAWLSPTVAKVGTGDWRMWAFGGNDKPVDMWTGESALGPWTLSGPCTLVNGHTNEWHGDIIYHEGVLYGLYSTRPNVYPMTSLDGITWNVGTRIVALDGYRPTLALSTEADHFDVWVSIYETQRVWYHRRPLTEWPAPPSS